MPGAWITIIVLMVIGVVIWAWAQGAAFIFRNWGLAALAIICLAGFLASLAYAAHLDRQRARQDSQDEPE